MKLSDWLDGEDLYTAANLGLCALLLRVLPGRRAHELLNLLWAIKWAEDDARFWALEQEEADNVIWERRARHEQVINSYRVWWFTQTYNKEKYFWLPRVTKGRQ